MAHVAFVGAGNGIEELGSVQAEHFLTSRAGRLVLDGLVLLPIAHDQLVFVEELLSRIVPGVGHRSTGGI